MNNKQVPAVDQIFWAGYSGITYLPATVAPIGFTPRRACRSACRSSGRSTATATASSSRELLEREFQAFVPPPDYR